jgi:hypothetical protein
VVSIASARLIAGRMVVRRRAHIDLPSWSSHPIAAITIP